MDLIKERFETILIPHFASIGSDVTRGFGSTSAHSYKEYFPQSEDTNMFLVPVNFDKFQKKLIDLKKEIQ